MFLVLKPGQARAGYTAFRAHELYQLWTGASDSRAQQSAYNLLSDTVYRHVRTARDFAGPFPNTLPSALDRFQTAFERNDAKFMCERTAGGTVQPHDTLEYHFHRFFRTTSHGAVAADDVWGIVLRDYIFYESILRSFGFSAAEKRRNPTTDNAIELKELFDQLTRYETDTLNLYTLSSAGDSFEADHHFHIGRLAALYLYNAHANLRDLYINQGKVGSDAYNAFLRLSNVFFEQHQSVSSFIKHLEAASVAIDYATRITAHSELAELQTDKPIEVKIFLLEVLRMVGALAMRKSHQLEILIPHQMPNALLILDTSYNLFAGYENSDAAKAALAEAAKEIHPNAQLTVEEASAEQQAVGYHSRLSLVIPEIARQKNQDTSTPHLDTASTSTGTLIGGFGTGEK